MKDSIRLILIAFAIVVGLTIILTIFIGGNSSPTSTNNAVSSDSPDDSPHFDKIIGDHWYGCKDQGYFDKITSYSGQGEDNLATEKLKQGVMTGECTLFINGEGVSLMGTGSFFSGEVKIRRKGQESEFWTFIEAVDPAKNKK